MNKIVLSLIVIACFFSSCSKKQDPFLISNKSIGMLTDSTKVTDLERIFPNDSIVKLSVNEAIQSSNYDIEVFDKTGKKLLVLSPNKMSDSSATITNVKIVDPRYITTKGITTESTFGEIQKKYKVSNIQNTIKNVVFFVNEIDAFFTIDKKELPAKLQFDSNTKIEAIHIPETAKIKYFMIGWN
ncbi:hypothetical protein BZARG_2811 [Bizionia argentinensis JUB59]|uniref:Uncharacterized protein n=1 Tax=Bizionia argentinensis JUB59 TaxID=1046627 RepID=G2EAB9_9FLAO|nr:hypothetical protein [Bizionia argentinensis]EGV44620.2 hypothetical protein BZARG_2811 [Bizionia argentinensis JUB59]